MNEQKLSELISALEEQYPVEQLKYKDIELWPIVRTCARSAYITVISERQEGKALASSTLLDKLKKRIEGWKFHLETLKTIKRMPSSDILFFTDIGYLTDNIDGKLYDRHVDPFIEFLAKQLQKTAIKATYCRPQSTLPSSEETYFPIHPIYLTPSLFDKSERDKISSFIRLNTMLLAILQTLEQAIGYTNLKRDITKILSFIFSGEDKIKRLLQRVKPKAVFIVCNYCQHTMIMTKLCKDLGIKTIEIQHGKQGIYHLLYTNWRKIPPTGYKLLPDVFWNWGKESERDTRQTMSAKALQWHTPVVGGNLWLAKWKNEDIKLSNEFPKDFKDYLAPYEKVILVSLQQWLKEPIPRFMLEVMHNSNPKWLWLLRLHPKQGNEDKIRTLATSINCAFEMEVASKLPLYYLLKYVNLHITAWSSVCVEALAFNIPTLLVHENGRDFFKKYIDNGSFFYADNKEAVQKFLTTDFSSFQAEDDYIQMNQQLAVETLRSILK